MSRYVKILLLLWLSWQADAGAAPPNIKSVGSLTFRCNGRLYTADSTHARGYAVKQTSVAYINGANSETMVIDIEWKGVKKPGTFLLNSKGSKAEFTINLKTYSLKQAGGWLKIVISSVKQQGSFVLLSGTFEGQLQDKNGNKAEITEGRFETVAL
jgi:hypothetical protein